MRPIKPIHRVSKMSASAINSDQYVLESHAIETVEYVECGVQLGVWLQYLVLFPWKFCVGCCEHT